jgi:hypothetical protein
MQHNASTPTRRLGPALHAAGVQARLRVGALYHRWELRRAWPYRLHGLEVRIEPEVTADPGVVIEKLGRALDLISRTDERQYRAAQARFSCILVKRGPGAQYWPDTRVCVLEPNALLSRSKAITALSIIHELTHARLAERIPIHLHVSRPRFERRCIRAQISFSQRLASAGWDMADVVQHYERALDALR